MKIAIGADHGGFLLKTELSQWLQEKGYQIQDYGAKQFCDSDDYPDFATPVGKAVAQGKTQRGIIICGSGVGACVAANKIRGIRACICHDTYSARQGVEHDNINVLCLGARIVGISLTKELVSAFLEAAFSGEERHRRRLEKVIKLEMDYCEGKN